MRMSGLNRDRVFRFCFLALLITSFADIHVAGAAEPPPSRLLTHYSITSANDFPGRDPRDWRVLGSNDGGQTWQTLDQRTNQIFIERLETKNYPVTLQAPCNLFRLEVNQVRDPRTANSVQISEVDLKGMVDGQEADLRPRRSDL